MATILSGGAGSRLWPISREQHPKPFLRWNDNESLLGKTYARALALPEVNEILTVTNHDLFFKTQDVIKRMQKNGASVSYILEPCARNTAAAVVAASLQVQQKHGDDAMLLVLPADHLITKQTAFADAVARAVQLAGENKLIAFGICPDAPETGYGYIEAEGERVIRFVEKPTREKAQEYLDSGRFYWNAGMFCFRAGVMLEEMRKYRPDILDAVAKCMAHSTASNAKLVLDAEYFAQVPSVSIDYAVMEKSEKIAVVPCDIGWSDVGSWLAFSNCGAAVDENGNSVEGNAILHNTKNSYIRSQTRVVGAVGVANLIVVDTDDALLIADKDSAQDVKEVYNALKLQEHEAYKTHRLVHRPWGTYMVLEEGTGFKIKRIVVNPGASLSLQMHHHRSEHWVVVSGEALVVNGDQQITLKTNESTYIPLGHKHRLANPGAEELIIIEVQSGDYLGEDDIVRFSDDYGRG